MSFRKDEMANKQPQEVGDKGGIDHSAQITEITNIYNIYNHIRRYAQHQSHICHSANSP